MWESIDEKTFLEIYCKEDYNNVTEDEILEDEKREDLQPTAENWQEKAAEIQQNMADLLADRLFDSIPTKDNFFFLKKLGFALYGAPQDCTGIGYDEVQLQSIKALAEAIVGLQGSRKDEILYHTIFVITFVEGKSLQPVPVFRVPKPNHQVDEKCPMMFVDCECRTYENWHRFLEENNLPKCWICYPVDGIYQIAEDEHVLVGYCQSPACSAVRGALEVLDVTSTVAVVGATAVGLASLVVPVAAPLAIAASVAGGTTGAYGMGRSIFGLVDRGRHGQSVSPTDPEARSHWISAAGSALNFASAGAVNAVSNAARAGQVASKSALIATDCLQVGSLVINGAGIVNHGYQLYLKKQAGEEPTALDYFQFASSVLFFSNSVINLQTAKTMFKQEQRNHIKQHRNALRSNRHRRQFDRMSRNTRRGMRATEGRATVIRAINNIENPNDFYAGIARASKQYKVYKAKITFTETGQICLNGKIALHPMELASLQRSERAAILTATKNLHKGKLTNSQYKEEMHNIFLRNKMEFTEQRLTTAKNICTAFGCKDLFKSIFKDGTEYYLSKPSVVESFFNLVMNAEYKVVFHLATQIAHKMGFKTTENIIQFLEFACPHFSCLYGEFQVAYDTYCSLRQNEISLSTAFHCIILNVFNSYTAIQNLRIQYVRFRNSGTEISEGPIGSNVFIDACPQNVKMNVPKFITFANLFYSVYIELQSALSSIQQITHFTSDKEFVRSLGILLENILEIYRTGKMFVEIYQQNTNTTESQCSPTVKCALFCRLAAVIAVKFGYVSLGKFFEFVTFMLHQLLRQFGQSNEDLEMLEVIIRSSYEYPDQLAELQRRFSKYVLNSLKEENIN